MESYGGARDGGDSEEEEEEEEGGEEARGKASGCPSLQAPGNHADLFSPFFLVFHAFPHRCSYCIAAWDSRPALALGRQPPDERV